MRIRIIVKKLKELFVFLLLIATFALCFLLSIAFEIFPTALNDSNALFSNAHYIKALLTDELFYKSIFNTYFKAIIQSSVIVVLFTLTVRLLKKKPSRCLFYILDVVVSSVAAFVYLIFDIGHIGYPLSYYPAHTIMYSESTIQTMKNHFILPDLFFALLSGVLAVFIYWIIESVYYTFENRA